MNDLDLLRFVETLLRTGLLAAVPLTLAALGETFAERSGLLNLGVEGMMLSGAFFGFCVAYNSGNPWVGVVTGSLVGLLLGLLFGLLAITLRVDQVLIGLAITLFGGGLTGFLFRDFYGRNFPRLDASTPNLSVPLLKEVPVVGPALFDQDVVVYLTWALVVLAAFVLKRTRFGLDVRATGENPFAADAAGVPIFRVRYLAIALGGTAAGLAGAFLSVSEVGFFSEGMTVGQGFIALAITMLGKWNPYRIAIGAVLFGALRSLSSGLQILGVDVRSEFVNMLPYIGIMLALVVLAGRTSLPAALAVPYERGHR